VFNIAVVFTFVAFWHDREMKLFAWGWMIAGLYLPELALTAIVNHIKWIKEKPYYHFLTVCAASLNCMFMMICNLVGYSIGIEGTFSGFNRLFHTTGLWNWVMILAVFLPQADLMVDLLKYRQEKQKNKKNMIWKKLKK